MEVRGGKKKSSLVHKLSKEEVVSNIRSLSNHIESDDSDEDIAELTAAMEQAKSRLTALGDGGSMSDLTSGTVEISAEDDGDQDNKPGAAGAVNDVVGGETDSSTAAPNPEVATVVVDEKKSGIRAENEGGRNLGSSKDEESRRSSTDTRRRSSGDCSISTSMREGGDSRASSPVVGNPNGESVSTQVFVPGSAVPMSRVKASPVRGVPAAASGSPVPNLAGLSPMSEPARARGASPRCSPLANPKRLAMTPSPVAWESTLRGANNKVKAGSGRSSPATGAPISSRQYSEMPSQTTARPVTGTRRKSLDCIVRPSSAQTSTSRRGKKPDSTMRRFQATTKNHVQLEDIPQLPMAVPALEKEPEKPEDVTRQLQELRIQVKHSDAAVKALNERQSREQMELREMQADYEDAEMEFRTLDSTGPDVTGEGVLVKEDNERAGAELLIANMESAIGEKEKLILEMDAKVQAMRTEVSKLAAGSSRRVQLEKQIKLLELQINEMNTSNDKQRAIIQEKRGQMEGWNNVSVRKMTTVVSVTQSSLLELREKLDARKDKVAETDEKLKTIIAENELLKINVLKKELKLNELMGSPGSATAVSRESKSKVTSHLKKNIAASKETVETLSRDLAYAQSQCAALRSKVDEKNAQIVACDNAPTDQGSPTAAAMKTLPERHRTQSRGSLLRSRDADKLQYLLAQKEVDELSDRLKAAKHKLEAHENLLLQHQLSPSVQPTAPSQSNGGSKYPSATVRARAMPTIRLN